MSKVTLQYAKALFEKAKEINQLDKVYSNMEDLRKVLMHNNKLSCILGSPLVGKDRKFLILKNIFGNTFAPVTIEFFHLVTQKNRSILFQEIISSFLSLWELYYGIKKAVVVTAFDLDDNLKLMFNKIAKNFAPCKSIVIDHVVNPKIIGGYIITVDGKRMDKSILTKLSLLKKSYYLQFGY